MSALRIASLLAALAFVATASVARADEEPSALDVLREAATSAPRDAAAQRAYGLALVRAGRFAEGERRLATYARLARGTPEALYLVASVAFERGDYRASRRACRTLEREVADDPWTRVCRARAFLVLQRSARAFDELEAVLAEHPEHVDALLALGEARRLRGEADEAERAFERAAELAPTRVEPWLGLGLLRSAHGATAEAIDAFRRAEAIDATWPDVELALGRLLAGEEALRRLRAAVAARAEWSEAELALGDAELAAGDATAARAMYERVIARDAAFAPAHAGIGRTWIALGDDVRAEAALLRALELVPNDARVLRALAALLARTSRNEDALERYRQAADADPSDPTPLVEAGTLALRLGRTSLAGGYLDRALARHPESGPVIVLSGDVLAARGDRDGARVAYRRALGLPGVSGEDVRRKLAALPAGTGRPR